MRLRLFSTLVLAGAVAFVLLAGTGAAQQDGRSLRTFQTPSGNIECFGTRRHGWSFACYVRSADRSYVLRPTGSAKGPYNPCDWPYPLDRRDPVLAYGKTWRFGPFRCESHFEGLRCWNRSDHGFFLSKERRSVFSTAGAC